MGQRGRSTEVEVSKRMGDSTLFIKRRTPTGSASSFGEGMIKRFNFR